MSNGASSDYKSHERSPYVRAPRILDPEMNGGQVEAEPVTLRNVVAPVAESTAGAPDAGSSGMKVEVAVADSAHKQLLYHLKNYDHKEAVKHGSEASDLIPEPRIQ